MSWGREWRPYVSVAQRRAKARRYAEQLAKKGRTVHPVQISRRTIATTFWGQAWCDNLESYSDYANRLPRGRTYVRNGSVIDVQIERGRIEAIVSGSEIYKVKVQITPLAKAAWRKITRDCSQSIDSLIDLLQGRFSQGVMERLTRQKDGLFPQPKEIKMGCSCPDWAVLCKHVAAVLYGVGARLDEEPELLFTLRDVDHLELISQAVAGDNLEKALGGGRGAALAGEDLGELFGIDLEIRGAAAAADATAASATPVSGKRSRVTAKRETKTKTQRAKAASPAVAAKITTSSNAATPSSRGRKTQSVTKAKRKSKQKVGS